MKSKNLEYYLNRFKKLRRDYRYGGAPHKPVLLISIIRLFERGLLQDHRIELSPELITTFREVWDLLVITPHKRQIALPFFHMKSEKFWKLICYPGKQYVLTKSKSIRSFKNLNETVAFAEIDPELVVLLLKPETRALLHNELIQRYFPHSELSYAQPIVYQQEQNYLALVNEPSETVYRNKSQELSRQLANTDPDEEYALRSAVFRSQLKKLYQYQCCVSGILFKNPFHSIMLDACHIKPFSTFEDDRITNGIPLTPTLHRAFDQGIFTISNDYTIQVKKKYVEENNRFNLKNMDGKKMFLPANEQLYPDPESIRWHRKMFR